MYFILESPRYYYIIIIRYALIKNKLKALDIINTIDRINNKTSRFNE